MADISERSFEQAIEVALLAAPAEAEDSAGGYQKRLPEDYDRTLCLISRDSLDFILATQPKEWARLKQHYGDAAKEQFVRRLAREIEKRGALTCCAAGSRIRAASSNSPTSTPPAV